MEGFFAYRYRMLLSLARSGQSFTEEEKRLFLDAVSKYNQKSIYMANPKRIEPDKIIFEDGDNVISIELRSTQALATPGRGLRTLTTILLEDSEYFRGRVTPGGQLFRVVSVDRPASETGGGRASDITDLALTVALMEYTAGKRDGSAAFRRKRAAVEEMKRLAVEAGLIAYGASIGGEKGAEEVKK